MSEAPEPQPASAAPSRSSARMIFVAVSAVTAVGILLSARAILLPFVLALVVAYVLTPLVSWAEARKVPRGAAILLVYFVVLGTLGGFFRLAVPRVGREIGALRHEWPEIVRTVKTSWVPMLQGELAHAGLTPAREEHEGDDEQLKRDEPAFVLRPGADGSYSVEVKSGVVVKQDHGTFVVEPTKQAAREAFDPNKLVVTAVQKTLEYAKTNTLELVKLGREVVAGVSRGIFIFSITLMLAAYVMLTRERILSFFQSLAPPDARASFRAFLDRVDSGLSGVVRGQLVICLVNGALSALGFGLCGLKYWPVMALVATVGSLIPIFGAIVSSVPAVALALTQSPGKAAFVLVWILGIHQLEANFLNPKILGDSAKIHPVLVVFALLAGEHWFGGVGALLAVPTLSVVQSLFLHLKAQIEADEAAAEPEQDA